MPKVGGHDESVRGGSSPLGTVPLPYRLSVLTERMSRIFAQRYEREFGIGIPEWRVMAVLGEQAPRSTQKVIEARNGPGKG